MTDREAALRRELDSLITDDGRIFARSVVEFARANPNTELHARFQWNLEQAAYQHWLSTARRLISVYVSTEAGERRTISLTVDRLNGGGYRDRDEVLATAEMRRMAVEDALAEILRWRERNSHLAPELGQIFSAIDRLTAPPPPAPPARRGRRPRPEDRPSA